MIATLFHAGVPIVAGSDTNLIGYGLNRELELYVQAGVTPLEAIRSATIVSARAMRRETDSGSIEPGKRADLVLVDGTRSTTSRTFAASPGSSLQAASTTAALSLAREASIAKGSLYAHRAS